MYIYCMHNSAVVRIVNGLQDAVDTTTGYRTHLHGQFGAALLGLQNFSIGDVHSVTTFLLSIFIFLIVNSMPKITQL